MKIDRDKFFVGYRAKFGALNQSQVDGLTLILHLAEGGNDWEDVRHFAYFLATTKHETAGTFAPIKEYGGDAYFEKRYGYTTDIGKRLGNKKQGDGAKYCGRGYMQITGKSNYVKFDVEIGENLIDEPVLALSPTIAYKIAVIGMNRGLFTGKKLSDYISGNKCQYDEARRIINGKDKAALIAGYATNFEAILKASQV